jgi:hypothetical protein
VTAALEPHDDCASAAEADAFEATQVAEGYTVITFTAGHSNSNTSSNDDSPAAVNSCDDAAAAVPDATVVASPEPAEDQPAAEVPSLASGMDSSPESDAECEKQECNSVTRAHGPAQPATAAAAVGVAASQAVTNSEICPCEADEQVQESQQEACASAQTADSDAAASNSSGAFLTHEDRPDDAEQLGEAVCLQQEQQLTDWQQQQQREADEDATEVLLGVSDLAAEIATLAAAGLVSRRCSRASSRRCSPVPETPMASSSAVAAALEILPASDCSYEGFNVKVQGFKAMLQANRSVLLASVLPAAAGAVLAIAGGCSLAQARRLRRQHQAQMAASAAGQEPVPDWVAAAAAGSGRRKDGVERVRGMVVYKGTARRICNL